jgi:hypothetical protein
MEFDFRTEHLPFFAVSQAAQDYSLRCEGSLEKTTDRSAAARGASCIWRKTPGDLLSIPATCVLVDGGQERSPGMQPTSRWIARLFFLAAVVVPTSAVLAQPTPGPAAGPAALGPCKGDIAKFCGGVQAGGGKIIACLKEHEAELADTCKGALGGPPRARIPPEPAKAGEPGKASGSVGGPTPEWGPMKGMQRSCGADIEKLCKEVQPGHGRVVACLNEHVGELSAQCKPLVTKVAARMSEPMEAHGDCAEDLKKLCADVKPGSGRMGLCLGEHSAELSPACKKRIEAMKARWEKAPGRPGKAGRSAAAGQ